MTEVKKILIADDDESFLQIMADKLRSKGFVVVAVKNGKEAVSMATAELPDLLLLDILMPEMSGLEAMKKLRTVGEWGKNVPIFIVTSVDPDDKTIRAVADDKPTYYLMKGGLDLDEMVSRIKEQLRG